MIGPHAMTSERERQIRTWYAGSSERSAVDIASRDWLQAVRDLVDALDAARVERNEALLDARAMAEPCAECASLRIQREDAQTASGPAADRARQEAIADLSHLLSPEAARTIVESLGGPLGSLRGTAQRIGKIIDEALRAQQTRDRMLRAADESMEASRRLLALSRSEPAEYTAGWLRGQAFKAAEQGYQAMEWAKEVGGR